jgi:hypothetical protein
MKTVASKVNAILFMAICFGRAKVRNFFNPSGSFTGNSLFFAGPEQPFRRLPPGNLPQLHYFRRR